VTNGGCPAIGYRLRAWVLSALLLPSASAWCAQIKVPLQLDYALLRQILLEQVYTGPNRTARAFDDGANCNSLVLSDPKVASDAGRIRIVSAAEASVGNVTDGDCSRVLQWRGFIELLEQPVLAPGLSAIQFTIVDSKLYDSDGKQPIVTGTLWDWMKTRVHPRLEPLKLDINGPLADLRSLLALMFPHESLDAIKSSLATLAVSDVRATDEGLALTLQFAVPETRGPAMAPWPEPPLTPDEAQKWEAALDRWDAFLTFVVKQAAQETELQELRQALLAVLLEGRYDLTGALISWTPGAPDPVRGLFIKSWKRLAPVLRRLSTNIPGTQVARYLGFIAAGNALEALDQLGAQMGFEISADGLRQLARTIAPQYTGDPLIYGSDVDSELRRLFGFGPPISLPETKPETDPGAWFTIRGAWAAAGADPSLVHKLNRWVPVPGEIDKYLPLVRDLLKQVAAAALDAGRLEEQLHDVYRRMSLATAWQESCWRQFIKDEGKIKPLTSNAGAIGIMQVNQRVWRGFYDRTALRQDIGYNASAGNEILLHYLVDYVITDRTHRNTDNLVRATYAAYNGGPGHIDRYRRKKAAKSLREIDRAFWYKYQTLKKNELAPASCWNVQLGAAAARGS
jgi:hypothetical protein